MFNYAFTILMHYFSITWRSHVPFLGERTFGVLTKLDLMDKGTNALDVRMLVFSFLIRSTLNSWLLKRLAKCYVMLLSASHLSNTRWGIVRDDSSLNLEDFLCFFFFFFFSIMQHFNA